MNITIKIKEYQYINIDILLSGFQHIISTKLYELSEAEISGGQKSRISFARSLAFKNDWLLLYEPLTGIEYDLLHKIINFASECFKTKTVILVSHNDTIKKIFSENFDMSLCFLSAP
ncbi:MAG: hypothetical protein P1P63_02710 [Treponemataceae bacterium]